MFEQTVAAAYERGQGVNMAAYGEIDDVIDPTDSRRWIELLFDEGSGEWWRRPGKKSTERRRLVREAQWPMTS